MSEEAKNGELSNSRDDIQEKLPTMEFAWLDGSCPNQVAPDVIFYWPDIYSSFSKYWGIDWEGETLEGCGWDFDVPNQELWFVFRDRSCRASLDMTTSAGYKSSVISVDTSHQKFPVGAANQNYCVAEGETDVTIYSKVMFLANAGCLENYYECYGDQSLMIYKSEGCQGDPHLVTLSKEVMSITPPGWESSLNVSYVAIEPVAAVILTTYTTYYPYGEMET